MSTVLMTAPTAAPTHNPAGGTRATDPFRCVAFTLRADADPGTLPRVLEFIAKRGLVPTLFTSQLHGDMLAITVEVVGLAKAESDHIANCLRQIPMVAQVLTSERTVPGELLACAE
jgi:acetolactate synthase regulatory subunit